ncbi:hypothetical protein O0555_15660 [Brevibacillus laterosporus]|uniref:hypothetical protein n=1 Tax=Bacillales TaxID=1385 RepID=UPI000F8D8B10|nr:MULTISPECIES: hypothetical protein [Bacillales]MCR8938770.1 hypothetical protein [Brevibacillus laterosporus]MCZ0841410.1 hypothetical protein [Brevibacillus laterosporus]MCZ0847698.1 hypothetical protein [Brevibacillus laterosporus]RUR59887.1 hypothetical protein ELS81_29445 [Bacillus sp. VKPM B-3276]
MTNVTILTDDNGVKREYREVERNADVGERIKIIAEQDSCGVYENGDIFIVEKIGHLGIYSTNAATPKQNGNNPSGFIEHREYVVLEPTDIIHVDGACFREEKREAKDGERILIVAAEYAEGWYTNGSVLTVREIPRLFNCVRVNEHGWLIYHREYVVITPLDEPATNNITVNLTINVASSSPSEILKAIVDSVQAELVKFVGAPNDEETRDKMTEVLTNKSRDEIVEQAKEDMWGLRADTSNVRNPALRGRGDIYIKNRLGLTADFIVNKEKRTVVCLLRGGVTPNEYARGIAKCSPDDCFNVHIGKAIALRRALELDVPTEYLTAPQPTEVRVGDVVLNWEGTRKTAISDVGHSYDPHGLSIGYVRACGYETVDDSRDQETEVTAVA